MKDQILALVGRHCETVRREAIEIVALVPPGAMLDAALHASLSARVHKLKGSSGTIGFLEISALCQKIETILAEGQAPNPPRDQGADLANALARLRDLALALRPEHSILHLRVAGPDSSPAHRCSS